jgi:hypothetical protein
VLITVANEAIAQQTFEAYAAYVLPQLHNILAHSNPRPFAGNLEGHENGAAEDVMTGDLVYHSTLNAAQPPVYPSQYLDPFTDNYHPIPYDPYAHTQPYLPPPPGLGFSPHLTYPYPMANALYHYPPTPAPAPAPATSDKMGNRQKGKKQGKQGNKTPQKEKTGSPNANLPRTSLLRPSKLHFYWHHHGWVTTHRWPSGQGGHHGDTCMFMKSRPSEFIPAMLAARTPDAVPGSANVQPTNVLPLLQCSPCTISPCHVWPSPTHLITSPLPAVTSVFPIHPFPPFAPPHTFPSLTEDTTLPCSP